MEKKLAHVKIRDLRVTEPWPELEKYAFSFDLAALPEIELHHVPYACILIQAVKNWKDSHSGNLPLNFKDKNEF